MSLRKECGEIVCEITDKDMTTLHSESKLTLWLFPRTQDVKLSQTQTLLSAILADQQCLSVKAKQNKTKENLCKVLYQVTRATVPHQS